MPAGVNGGVFGRATEGCRRPGRKTAALGALSGLVLGLSVGCAQDSGPATATWQRIDAPVMTDSLLLKPVDRGRLTSVYGVRYNPFSRRRQMHRGIDWAAPRGTAVRAAGDGIVAAVERRGGYGRYLRIDHGGTIETAYAHLERFASGMRPGQIVRQGDPIGKVGSTGRATGPHLHYEILVAGNQIDPLAFAAPEIAQATDPIEPAGELAIGGPDIADDELAETPDSTSPDIPSAPPATIGPSSIIWVKDLLSRTRP
jgi:Peptidase family M23